MLDKSSLLTMDSFFRSSFCTSEFTVDKMLGAMTSFISCPEYIEEANLEELIAGNTEVGFKQLFEPGSVHHALIDIFNEIDNALVNDRFSLVMHYNVDDSMQEPPAGLSQWCEGYLQGAQLTNGIWQEDFNLLDSIPDFKKGRNLAEECDACLNLIAMFADWQKALKINEDPILLKTQVLNLCCSIELGVCLFYQLGLALNQIKIESIDFGLFNIEKETDDVANLGVLNK
ncbi:hypothetical protein CJF42_16460 [Pseudoalteromonas sp. NBT06-2]|uniref:UPF0149 family protein n=1 Tax=Pseudoalteromonas sp. NBT06-2 TaxID=2025950 RepID=UPI000BA621D3|nr:UPF0149 family protein [Pseudoalteromonas sp. NBT06-2]PAJ73312.1 hypothetical protein CJF42_16460 [Pseudoalteromonas sp. NBT06-2]